MLGTFYKNEDHQIKLARVSVVSLARKCKDSGSSSDIIYTFKQSITAGSEQRGLPPHTFGR